MTLQDTSINNPCSPQGDTQLKLSHTTSTEPETVDVKWKREFDAYKPIQQIVSGCLIDTEHISTYFGKGQGTYPITTKVYIRARPTIRVWQKTPSFNKIDVVAKQSDQLLILRRRNALLTDIARYNASPWSTKGHPTQVSTPTSTGPGSGDVNL